MEQNALIQSYNRAIDQFYFSSIKSIQHKLSMDVSMPAIRILAFLTRRNEPVTPTQIAQESKVKKPTVTSLIQTMLRNGLVQKLPSTTDRRSYQLTLTERGQEMFDEIRGHYIYLMNLVIESLGEDAFRELIDLLQQASAAMDTYTKQEE